MRRLVHQLLRGVVIAALLAPTSVLAQTQGPTFRSPDDQELTQAKAAGNNWNVPIVVLASAYFIGALAWLGVDPVTRLDTE